MTEFVPLYERYEVDERGCWIWKTRKAHGYAQFRVNGKIYIAHRYFYEFYNSTKIPPGMYLDHLCRRKACVNPKHLELVTPRENNLRCSYNPSTVNSKKTECIHGHPLTEDNVYVTPAGARQCRTCHRRRAAAYRVYVSKYDSY
jgi:hypothetical protein